MAVPGPAVDDQRIALPRREPASWRTAAIGLSLGADLCWPICYEEILRRLDLALALDGDTVRFEVDRVTIEPFDLRQPCSYDLVVDRLTHWYTTAASGSRSRCSWTASTCSTTRGPSSRWRSTRPTAR